MEDLTLEELEKRLMNLVSSFQGRTKTPYYEEEFIKLSTEIKKRL